jgi:N-succinyldiaminopimelate aminotransferase
MPRHPDVDPALAGLGGSVFSDLAPRIAALTGEIYPLHIGDTWMDPSPGLRWRDLKNDEDPRPHLYCDPHGITPLIDRLVEKVRTANRIPIDGPEQLQVTVGATGGLTATAIATISAGDEVLLLAPYWPLIRGIVISAGGVPVEVPVITESLDGEALGEALEARIGSRTTAIYISTPSNPTGKVLDETLLASVADVARRHSLWIWSDEVYEHYAYRGDHVSIGSLAPERTATVFSFSKAYGMAGYRCGYVVGPQPLMSSVRRAATYAWYSVPTPSQQLAARAIDDGGPWLTTARASYLTAGDAAADRLGLPRPGGGQFLFWDVAPLLDDRGLRGFLKDCLDRHLILAPGSSFGADYGTWVRLCFTCVEPDVVQRGVDRLAEVIASKG